MKALKLDEEDNVAVLLGDAAIGDVISIMYDKNIIETVKVADNVPKFHKIAINDIHKNDVTKKYGEVIGVAVCEILRGEYVHVHNIVSIRGSV